MNLVHRLVLEQLEEDFWKQVQKDVKPERSRGSQKRIGKIICNGRSDNNISRMKIGRMFYGLMNQTLRYLTFVRRRVGKEYQPDCVSKAHRYSTLIELLAAFC
ncbi:uncharacterized protein LOC110118883 [Ceratitis capitata]|uniref:uncharacterized protein LOC110118883 n=1 Tax=Ceratitis capitata TaxID=7213 RepID=UPI000A122F41|nr:uncharacterized protein LOC110118883 [Ceratitis capitata]